MWLKNLKQPCHLDKSVMPKDHLPINETSPNTSQNESSEQGEVKSTKGETKHLQPLTATTNISNPEPFRGFLLAAYKSIANTARSLKITRLMFVSYLLILVVIPPVIIMVAFVTFPLQTARFFNFQVNYRANK